MSTSSHSDKKNIIVRQPPKSFANALTTSQFTNGEKPNYELALKQHNEYVETFKKLGLNVIVLESEEEYAQDLEVYFCETCFLVQTQEDLDLDEYYKGYLYECCNNRKWWKRTCYLP